MKHLRILAAVMVLLLLLTACGVPQTEPESKPQAQQESNAVEILLRDDKIQVDGVAVGTDPASAVYVAKDIVYYEAGKDFTYGEGSEADAHSPEDAAAHTVVHITQPGVYTLSGKLSLGQIAVDLGDGAQEDPNAVVTLILSGVDITCRVAPAVIFYNVYECGSKDTETASANVDTSKAGANIIIADGTENVVSGSYVARIYKADSVVLNEDGTEVEDGKKLHKYDGAFYSKMSMNIGGGKESTGILRINAENEGLDSELHLTLNGGNVYINSGNDGINTNEDGVSVTTINGGSLTIRVTGETGEGDGIDSNGYLVINGGTVIAAACADSADAGIDSDLGIHINGGTVLATGHMLDRLGNSGQTYAVFTFAQKQTGAEPLSLKSAAGEAVMTLCPQNDYSVLVYSSPDLKEGTYTLFSGEQQLAGQGGMTGMRPDGMQPPEGFEDMQPPQGQMPSDGEGQTPPAGEGQIPPNGQEPPDKPERPGNGFAPNGNSGNGGNTQSITTEFKISEGENLFAGIAPVQ